MTFYVTDRVFQSSQQNEFHISIIIFIYLIYQWEMILPPK